MLTEKQSAFVKEYALTGNATRAAVKAGYSDKTAHAKGHTLRHQLQIQIEDETRRKIPDVHPPELCSGEDSSSHVGTLDCSRACDSVIPVSASARRATRLRA